MYIIILFISNNNKYNYNYNYNDIINDLNMFQFGLLITYVILIIIIIVSVQYQFNFYQMFWRLQITPIADTGLPYQVDKYCLQMTLFAINVVYCQLLHRRAVYPQLDSLFGPNLAKIIIQYLGDSSDIIESALDLRYFCNSQQ